MEVLKKWKGQRLFDHYRLNINAPDLKKREKKTWYLKMETIFCFLGFRRTIWYDAAYQLRGL